MQNKRFGSFITSSEDPEKIANSVKGIVLGLSAIILLIAQYFGIPFTETDVTVFATQLGLAVGAIWTIYGLGLKVVAVVFRKY